MPGAAVERGDGRRGRIVHVDEGEDPGALADYRSRRRRISSTSKPPCSHRRPRVRRRSRSEGPRLRAPASPPSIAPATQAPPRPGAAGSSGGRSRGVVLGVRRHAGRGVEEADALGDQPARAGLSRRPGQRRAGLPAQLRGRPEGLLCPACSSILLGRLVSWLITTSGRASATAPRSASVSRASTTAGSPPSSRMALSALLGAGRADHLVPGLAKLLHQRPADHAGRPGDQTLMASEQ